MTKKRRLSSTKKYGIQAAFSQGRLADVDVRRRRLKSNDEAKSERRNERFLIARLSQLRVENLRQ